MTEPRRSSPLLPFRTDLPHLPSIMRALLCLLIAASALPAQQPASLRRQDGRATAIMAYHPTTPSSAPCRGVAIISPGAGGSEQGYRYLGDAMAALGYLAVVVGHRESGRRALMANVRGSGVREGLEELIAEPQAYEGRYMDLAAAREWARERCPGRGSILLGHSMGAATVMMQAGAKNLMGMTGAADYDAYVALSPQGVGEIFPGNAWSELRRPVLSITGTRDTELGGASWQTRTQPFRNMPPGCKWLGVITGATHMHFAGSGRAGRVEPQVTRLIAAFLDGVRRGDCQVPRQRPGIEVTGK